MRKEDQLSKAVAQYLTAQYPTAIYHFDLSSGAKTSIGMAMRNKSLNRHRGFPDLFICEPRNGYSGLFIELKKQGTKLFLKDGKTLVANEHIQEQREMMIKLCQKGYAAVFGVGFDEVKQIVDTYLR